MRVVQTILPTITIAQRAELLVRQKLELDAALERVKDDLKALVAENNGEPIIAGNKRVSMDPMPGRKTLDKAKLVANGVTTDIIVASTKTGAGFVQLNVRDASKADIAAAQEAA